MIRLFISTFFIILLLMGCSKNPEITEINDVKLDDLMEYKQTHLGENSAVSSIIISLPGGETYREFELTEDSLKVIYGIKDGSDIKEDVFSNFWLNNDAMKKNFIYNAAAMFILIENVQKITFELDSNEYYSVSFQKDAFEKTLPHSFREYKNNNKLWEKDIINGLVKSTKDRNSFYDNFPLNH